MSLYNSFKVRKTNGILLDFKSITKEELQTLFFEETINDAQIADLFNVTHSPLPRDAITQEQGVKKKQLPL